MTEYSFTHKSKFGEAEIVITPKDGEDVYDVYADNREAANEAIRRFCRDLQDERLKEKLLALITKEFPCHTNE